MKLILILILCVTSHIFVAAQTEIVSKRKAFEGSWLFDAKASDRSLSERHTGDVLEIRVSDLEFTVVHRQTTPGTSPVRSEGRSTVARLFTDGRGEVSSDPILSPGNEVRSTTRWKKNSLEREYDTSVNGTGSIRRSKMMQIYEVTKDGNKLIISVRPPMELSDGVPTSILKAVYTKQD